MNKILSHQHVWLPVWTQENHNDRHAWAPDMLVHVQVTIIRMRYQSVFEEYEDDDEELQDVRRPRLPSSYKKSPHKNLFRDPRVHDPRFRNRYMLN